MEKQIRYCTAADGVRIAYATYGSGGYPLILVPGWVSHLDIDAFLWDLVPDALLEISKGAITVIRYDKRGTGLSQRGDVDLTVDSRVKDIEAVADALKLRRFALDGVSEGGPVAMAYAAKYPRRVSHLIVYGSFAAGAGGAVDADAAEAMLQLIGSQWGLATDIFTARLLAGASVEDVRNFTRLQRKGASAEDAVALMRMNMTIDIRDRLTSIKAPTLVIHGRQDEAVPFEYGREIAQLIPNARFVAHDGGHYPTEQYRPAIFGAIIDFLGDVARPKGLSASSSADASPEPSAARLTTIVFTDLERNTDILQRLGDAAWRDLLREHERITRDQLKRHGGDEIKTIGDSFMASFGSATRALECAVALQRAFHEWNDTERGGQAPLRVRVGVNAGEPIAEGGDLFGTSVTVASRIASTAAGGEVLVSNVVRELVAGKGFLFSDRGDAVLRGFEDPVRMYELRWREPA